MTENKQITIEQVLPLLSFGFVAMDEYGTWYWFATKPYICIGQFSTFWWPKIRQLDSINLSKCFNIKKFDGDWKDSLMEIKNANS